MIKYVCDMCGEDLHREGVVFLSFDGAILEFPSFDIGDLHLCFSCARRAYNWITNRGESSK